MPLYPRIARVYQNQMDLIKGNYLLLLIFNLLQPVYRSDSITLPAFLSILDNSFP